MKAVVHLATGRGLSMLWASVIACLRIVVEEPQLNMRPGHGIGYTIES